MWPPRWGALTSAWPSPLSLDIDTDPKDSNRYVVMAANPGCRWIATITSRTTRRWRRYARPTRSTWRRCSRSPASTMPTSALPRSTISNTSSRRRSGPTLKTATSIKVYNPMSFTQLKALAPQFPWDSYIKARGISQSGPSGERQVIVAAAQRVPEDRADISPQPRSRYGATTLPCITSTTKQTYLPKTFDDASFAFFGTVLSGSTQQLPRATRALYFLEGRMGFALGKLYVAKYFPPEAQAKIVALVNNLIKTYDADIRTLTWMTPATRDKALDKLHHMSVQIGYPAHWRDYSSYVVKRGDLLGNGERGYVFSWQPQVGAARQAGGSDRVAIRPADGERANNFLANAMLFPGGIPTAAVLRSERRRCGQLRRHRRGDRPRDQPQFRRPGLEIRSRRLARQLVDSGRPPGLRGEGEDAWARSTMPSSRCPACTSTAR